MFEYPPDLQIKLELCIPYYTESGFKDGTPDYIMEYDRELSEYYHSVMDGNM